MKVTIVSHDNATGMARVKFEHKDVVHEDDYNLKLVIPGSTKIFDEMGMEFDETHQLRALDRLTATIEAQIDSGIITNPVNANANQPEYSEPPVQSVATDIEESAEENVVEEPVVEEKTQPSRKKK